MSPRLSCLAIACATLMAAGCASNDPGAPAKGGAVQQPTAPSTAQSKSAADFHPADVEVVAAQFGVFGADPSGRRMLYETDKFPALVAAPYGWFIVFKTDKPTVVWREEFELPVAPPTWGPGEALGIFQVSPDRKTAVTERIIPTKLGFIANEWRYASGDPVGAHKMRVYIDGQLIREFSFAIEKMPDDGTQRRNPHRGGSAPGSST
ncbi:MAG: hypothetical protein ACXWVT_02005 [Burkholderiaceae bacterium]